MDVAGMGNPFLTVDMAVIGIGSNVMFPVDGGNRSRLDAKSLGNIADGDVGGRQQPANLQDVGIIGRIALVSHAGQFTTRSSVCAGFEMAA